MKCLCYILNLKKDFLERNKPLEISSYIISANKKELREFNNYFLGSIKLKLEDEYRDILSFGK